MSNLVPTALGECCDIVSGSTPTTHTAEYWDGNILWATPKDLSSLRSVYIDDTLRKITDKGLASTAAAILPSNSVLLSSRAPIGLVAINSLPMATNQGFKSLIPKHDRVDARFLYYWLKAHRNLIESLGNGATFKEISRATLAQVEIQLPPLETQHWIARLLHHVDVIRNKRRKTIALLDDLAQSIFLDMFQHTIQDGPISRELGDIASVSSGITVGRKQPTAELREVPYVTVLNVQNKRLDLHHVKRIMASQAEIDRYRLIEGDLLLTEGGDPDKLGRGTTWHNEIPECIHQNHIFRVRINNNTTIIPRFLNWLISSEGGRRYFLRSAKQTTGIASINASQLRRFPLTIPPIEEQLEFERRFLQVEEHKTRLAAHLAELDALFASVQDRAFRGEL